MINAKVNVIEKNRNLKWGDIIKLGGIYAPVDDYGSYIVIITRTQFDRPPGYVALYVSHCGSRVEPADASWANHEFYPVDGSIEILASNHDFIETK